MSSGGGNTFLFASRQIFPLHPLHLDMLPKIDLSQKGVSTKVGTVLVKVSIPMLLVSMGVGCQQLCVCHQCAHPLDLWWQWLLNSGQVKQCHTLVYSFFACTTWLPSFHKSCNIGLAFHCAIPLRECVHAFHLDGCGMAKLSKGHPSWVYQSCLEQLPFYLPATLFSSHLVPLCARLLLLFSEPVLSSINYSSFNFMSLFFFIFSMKSGSCDDLYWTAFKTLFFYSTSFI